MCGWVWECLSAYTNEYPCSLVRVRECGVLLFDLTCHCMPTHALCALRITTMLIMHTGGLVDRPLSRNWFELTRGATAASVVRKKASRQAACAAFMSVTSS